ncbi:methyltransferase, partial [Acidovorax cavernicola]|uniref:methyltransferase n=1 Tax=Acidovorax cavernicola TaxID=1675792 RepID=UPI002570CA6A
MAWGCAQGDGADFLASHIDPRQLVGVDFSGVAIEQASRRYPAIRFLAENWVGEKSHHAETFDVVFSSNTLEHFHNPWEVLEELGEHAKKAVVLALPYREMDRIDEHFYSFLPANVPVELSNGFGLVWSRVIDCRGIENTLWNGEQIFLVYAEKSWLSSLKLTLGDCEIGHDNQAARIGHEVAERQEQISHLQQDLAARDAHIAELDGALGDRDARITRLDQDIVLAQSQISSLQQERQLYIDQVNGLINSRSWRITRPLRVVKRLFNALFDASERYHLLKAVYWRLPQSLRSSLNKYRYKYVAQNIHVRDAAVSSRSQLPTPDWVLAANAVQKIVIIPCGFEFDELVNQRPINAAKYFSKQGYVVIFIAWQWSRGELLKKPCGQVWPGIYQVPLYEFIDSEKSLSARQLDALYLLTMPARILVDLVPSFRARGYSIAYDVMDEWEEFHKSV